MYAYLIIDVTQEEGTVLLTIEKYDWTKNARRNVGGLTIGGKATVNCFLLYRSEMSVFSSNFRPTLFQITNS